MTKPEQSLMDKLFSLAKQRGIVFPGSEIYGGLANTWDYGPLGAQMRMNLKQLWWQQVVERRPDMVGLDGAILMNPKVWEASGHTETFNDPLIECKSCNTRFRADQISFKNTQGKETNGVELTEAIVQDYICPACKETGTLTEPRKFNLMFQTSIGPVSDSGTKVYLRPETAQAIFVNFRNILNTSRLRLPFGVAQIGKAFRNEITPGNFIFRTLEFEQMEIEYFIEEAGWETEFSKWQDWMQQWAMTIGIDHEKLHTTAIPEDELAHYSKKTVDFEFDFPFGKSELWGLAYRTNFDLTNHQTQSGEKLEYTDPYDPQRKLIPHVIEPSMGVDRTLLAILLSAYDEEEVNGETRTVLRLKSSIAPYQVAVLPLMKKPELTAMAQTIFSTVVGEWRTEYDETQSIGKRYRRQDEIGTPLCITVDFDSLEDNAVTIRDRDSMQQERVSIDNIQDYIKQHINR